MYGKKTLTIEYAELQILYWIRVKETLMCLDECQDDNLETRVIKKYLKLGSLSDVAFELNNEGFRNISPRTRQRIKFYSNDISDIIRTCSIENDFMLNLARQLLDNHYNFTAKIYN